MKVAGVHSIVEPIAVKAHQDEPERDRQSIPMPVSKEATTEKISTIPDPIPILSDKAPTPLAATPVFNPGPQYYAVQNDKVTTNSLIKEILERFPAIPPTKTQASPIRADYKLENTERSTKIRPKIYHESPAPETVRILQSEVTPRRPITRKPKPTRRKSRGYTTHQNHMSIRVKTEIVRQQIETEEKVFETIKRKIPGHR